MTPTPRAAARTWRPIACASCDAPGPAVPRGWWGTAAVALCPGCVPLLTPEDHDELGATFAPLVPDNPREE